MSARIIFVGSAVLTVGLIAALGMYRPIAPWGLLPVAPLVLLGAIDMGQQGQRIRRTFPVVGGLRSLFEGVRPELHQYVVESKESGRPFSRELRCLVHQRAKNTTDTPPFGSQRDLMKPGYEWINHSLVAREPREEPPAHPHRRPRLHASVPSMGGAISGA